MANALMVVCFSLVLLLTSCGGNEETTTLPAPASQAATSVGFLSTMTASLSQGQFTLNNPWSQADLNYENISATIGYQAVVDSKPDGQVRPYTTLVQQYWAKRRQCEEDYNTFLPSGSFDGLLRTYHFTDRKCYPTHEWVNGLQESTLGDELANQVLYRYGYYCGGGYPNFGPFDPAAPEPLDSVDYCCRLHDAQTWANRGDYSNECGMAMCLRQATALPDGVWAQLPDVEEARQHWYGNGAFGGAAYACPGNQSNDAPPPTVGP
jgi:hypothetical protein